MLNAADWAQMAADLAEIRGDNPVSITIRRGETTLAAQTVRVARVASFAKSAGSLAGGEEHRGRAVILGATSLDIQAQDRFTVAGVLYRVVLVRPNHRAGIMAEAEIVE